MSDLTYNKLINTTVNLYLDGKYISAYEYITGHAPLVDGNEAQIFNFRYAIASRAGMTDIAMKLLDQAVVEKKFWYSYEYLMSDDDLTDLRHRKEFENILKICREREAKAKKASTPRIKIQEPSERDNGSDPGLIVALHGNEENIRITEGYWNTTPFNRYVKAFPQSSDVGFSDAYFWNQPEEGAEELHDHLNKIVQDYAIDADKIILGGFSAGARTALHFAVHYSFQIKGLILVCPWLPEIEDVKKNLSSLKDQGTKVYILAGGRDTDCLDQAEDLKTSCAGWDIPHRYRRIECLDHDYPVRFPEIQQKALDFILA